MTEFERDSRLSKVSVEMPQGSEKKLVGKRGALASGTG